MPTPEELAATAAATAATTTAANSETGNAPGSEATKATAETTGEKLFTQADLDAKIADRLARERTTAQAKADKAVKDAEEAQRIAQGDFQKLAEERKTQLDALAPAKELADRLSEIVAKQLDAELATWPESVRAIMPKDEAPLLERIEWADRTRPLAQELLAAQAGAGNGQAQQQQVGTPGVRYPAQGTGGGGAQPTTSKTAVQNVLNQAYAPRKAAPP